MSVPGAFGPYRVLHQVGTGVLGPVYRALEDDQPVAIKFFHLDLPPEQVEIFGNALADIVKVGVSHPAMVAPLAAGFESGTPFMTYEYVEAESLDVALRRAPRPARGLAWITALAAAVDAAHGLGLVHGSLHQRDVLVTADGVYATGFGIGSALEHVRLPAPVRRPYTAPEVGAGRRWGPAADRFSVAVLAYELLTGTRPSARGDEAIAELPGLRPDVADPAGLQQAFRNALAEDPDIRSASAAGFVAALARAIGDGAAERRPAASPGGGPRRMEAPAAGPAGVLAGRGSASEPTPSAPIFVPGVEFRYADQEPGDAADAPPGPEPHRPWGARSQPPPERRSAGPRRAAAVVAVPDEVRRDPLDEPVGVPLPAPRPARDDDDIPPPPSPTSMSTMAPLFAAVAVAIGLAYLAVTGLDTLGGEAAGDVEPPAGAAAAEVEVEQGGAGADGGALRAQDADPAAPVSEALAGGDPAAAAGDSRPAGGADPAPAGAVNPPPVDAGDPAPAVGGDLAASVGDPAPVAEGGDLPPPAPRPVDPDPPVRTPPQSAAAVESPAPARPPEAVSGASTAGPPAQAAAEPDPEPTPAAEVGFGSLHVVSRPGGAAVSVNDVVVGLTPLEVSDVPVGAHEVRIEMTGYRPWVTEVDVAGAERVRVGASLQPEGRR